MIQGEITLDGSKSISNRILIIRSLCEEDFAIHRLSTSDDTNALIAGLKSQETTIDIGAAGTTMRFLTARMACMQGRKTILTGSERMKQRPIGVLVDALRSLGAKINYLENEGFPPIEIEGQQLSGGRLEISAGISSQYLSALLMIASSLEQGLELVLLGELVSRPYLEMTLKIMEQMGVKHEWIGQSIIVPAQKYQAKEFTVEADWSAASYHYALAALADKVDLQLNGLFEESTQGDSVLASMMQHFGIETKFTESGIHLSKQNKEIQVFNYDFIECPDLAQTLVVLCAALGIEGHFSGLQTLAIKETDRTLALQTELAKMQGVFKESEKGWKLHTGKLKNDGTIAIDTYHDHRMAMAFAPLAMVFDTPLTIKDPQVVTKSYIRYWEDLQQLGFQIAEV